MHGGLKSERITFSLTIIKGILIAEKKVILLTKEIKYPATIFNYSRKSIAILLRSRNSGVRAKVANAQEIQKGV